MLDAIKLLFIDGGEHLMVRRIAAEVGISDAAIYRHFKSKRSIISNHGMNRLPLPLALPLPTSTSEISFGFKSFQ